MSNHCMTYQPGMEDTCGEILEQVLAQSNAYNPENFTVEDVQAALAKEKRDFYDRECEALKLGTSSLLQGYYKYEKRQIRNMTHMERFKDGLYLFDYLNKEAYSGQARILLIGS